MAGMPGSLQKIPPSGGTSAAERLPYAAALRSRHFRQLRQIEFAAAQHREFVNFDKVFAARDPQVGNFAFTERADDLFRSEEFAVGVEDDEMFAFVGIGGAGDGKDAGIGEDDVVDFALNEFVRNHFSGNFAEA